MPMFFVRRKPYHIARPNFLDWAVPTLRPSKARRDDQRLTERMRMPCGAGTQLERDARATNTCRLGGFEQRINPNVTRKPIRWPLVRRLRSLSFNFHGFKRRRCAIFSQLPKGAWLQRSFTLSTSSSAFQLFSFETRSLPSLTRSYPRRFTFYVAHPIRSIQLSATAPTGAPKSWSNP